MAKGFKITTDLGELTESLFSDATTRIFNLVNLNVLVLGGFPVPMGVLGPIPANSYGDFLNRYNTIRLGPEFDGKVADTLKARNILQKATTENGNWFNTFCNGDKGLLQKTGYPLQKENEAQGKLGQTTLSVISEPITGNMDFFITNLKEHNIRYGIMWTIASNPEINPAKWPNFYYASQKDGTIPGFITDEIYKFVSFGMGTDKDLTYSEVETVKAL